MRRLMAVTATVVAVLLAGCTDKPERGAPPAPPLEPVVVSLPPPLGAIERTFVGLHDHDPVGAGWPVVRFGSYRAWDAGVLWRDIEVAPGSYDFTRMDAIVDTAEQRGARVLMVLGQTPPFHAKRPDDVSFYGPGASSPPRRKAWEAYVRAAVTRYGDRPVDFQVWNEPNVSGFWSGTPRQMAKLTAAASEVVDEVSPESTLVAPALAQRLIGQRAWFADFYAQRVGGRPVADYVDVVAVHLYPEADDDAQDAMLLLDAARVRLDELEVDKPIWNTEVNFGITGLEVEPAPVEEQQAQVAQTLLLNAAEGIRRVYWYGWDQRSTVDTILSEEDGTPTPAGLVFGTVADWLVGSVVERCAPDAEGTFHCQLRTSDGVRHVYWNDAGPTTAPAPAGGERYESADGTRTDLTPGEALPVGPVPVMVEVDTTP